VKLLVFCVKTVFLYKRTVSELFILNKFSKIFATLTKNVFV
jgi:hypothetical protein